ncbi:hypothetical protein RDI58_022126 [Solanum bulbocastanum]|uniref:Uncharacterized protein n=1 Tax=Solanum bulbocastanum TaxID=147425 RepID=A0AAN8T7F8_SOLBU
MTTNLPHTEVKTTGREVAHGSCLNDMASKTCLHMPKEHSRGLPKIMFKIGRGDGCEHWGSSWLKVSCLSSFYGNFMSPHEL